MYELNVTLVGSKPKIWRALEVRSDLTFAQLHKVIQVAMGWEGYHLHMFRLADFCIGVPDDDDPEKVHDESAIALFHVVPCEGFEFDYEYDFGDCWLHRVAVEEIVDPENAILLEGQWAACTEGRRACPPEDVGGIWGYAEFLKAMRDRKHPRHKECREWIGGDFDPNAFDIDDVNSRLRDLERPRRKRGRRVEEEDPF